MKYIYPIIIAILLVTCVNLIVQNNRIKKSLYDYESVCEDLNNNLAKSLEFKDRRDIEFTFNGTKIPSQFKVTDSNNSIIDLNSIGSDKIIFYFSEYNCGTCIDSEFDILNNEDHGIKKEDVILLVNSASKGYIRHLRRANKDKSNIYRMEDSYIDSLPKLDHPYYFMFDSKSNRIHSFFIPQKEYPESTKSYLTTISNRIHSQ